MKKTIKKFVVIRTRSAGVHAGYLESRKGTEVELSEARRIWRWQGANTLNEVASKGCAENSSISAPVDLVLLTEAIEIISASKEAEANLKVSRWQK